MKKKKKNLCEKTNPGSSREDECIIPRSVQTRNGPGTREEKEDEERKMLEKGGRDGSLIACRVDSRIFCSPHMSINAHVNLVVFGHCGLNMATRKFKKVEQACSESGQAKMSCRIRVVVLRTPYLIQSCIVRQLFLLYSVNFHAGIKELY
jgi:hypothetical protein